jgi:hypothetical protein
LNGIVSPYNKVYNSSNCQYWKSDGNGWCPGPEYNDEFHNLTTFAKQLVDQYAGYGGDTSHEAIKYYEIWNEPNNDGATYWHSTGGAGGTDWADLIKQTYALENAIQSEYTADDVTSTPIFVGPGIASRGNTDSDIALCGASPCAGAATGFLGTSETLGGSGVTGASLISIGSFHLYPAYDEEAMPSPTDTADCSNTGSTSDTTVECTGTNLTSAVTNRLTDFNTYSISQVFMTEGSWMHNDNFSESTNALIYQDMRAYVARFTLLMAAGTYTSGSSTMNVGAQYWFQWQGSLNLEVDGADDYGTLCDGLSDASPNYPCYTSQASPGDIYGGYAYGQVINWLSGNKITACSAGTGSPAPCTDTASSVWVLPITVSGSTPTELALWTWDGSSVSCPTAHGCPSLTGYGHYQTVKSSTVNTLGSSITIGEEPILLEP